VSRKRNQSAPEANAEASENLKILNEIMVLLEGIELSTSPLPKQCTRARALISLAFSRE
jgi:hypothetical protein